MTNFKTVTNKLEQFIKKYYTNELLKGAILFFTIGLLYFMMTLFIEHVLWLNTTARTILFWLFIAVEVGLFIKFIILPLLQLFKLRQGIDYEYASQIIGNHFPEVNDKLLNILQLNKSTEQSDLLLASIEQKAKDLKPIPFKYAINFKTNTKYLKYAAIPVLILLLSFVTGKMNWFNDSYERVVNYQMAYEPPAPFQFFVLNQNLQTLENTNFTLEVSTVGELIPENAQIEFNGQTHFLKPVGAGKFQYQFNLPKQNISFELSANGITSKPYVLDVVNTPNLVNLEMQLHYPAYAKKRNEVLKSTGSAVVPEGTKVTWFAKTKSTDKVAIYASDTLYFKENSTDVFEASKQVFNNYNYSITTSNTSVSDYENLGFSIDVIKDNRPELNVKMKKDSLDLQSLYFYGQASDDYGLRKLQLVYYQIEDKKNEVPITISKSNFTDFVTAFPNDLSLKEGVPYQLYFEVFDNNGKRTKSSVFNYRKRTQEEEEQKQLNEQNKTINDISKTFEKLKEQDKQLEELSKTQKEKKQLNFNEKKAFEQFLKRQKEQEQLMKNFNKKLQDNLEQFQNENKKEDPFKEDLKERLKENEEQLKKDEKLLEELEKFKDKINKEAFTQKLEELAKQNKNKQRSMKQLLELTKRFYVTKKAEKLQKQLEDLSKKQEELSEKEQENNKDAQEQLNKEFEELQKELEDLKQEDRRLQKPIRIPQDKPLEDMIKYDQKKAKEALEKEQQEQQNNNATEAQKQKQNAKKKQKQAAKQIKELSEKLKQSAQSSGSGEQMQEDIDTLRQILENLLLYSFDQEELMDTFKTIETDNNNYGKNIVKQHNLRTHFEHVDDSLFALSLRQPKLSERVNTQISNVYYNIDKALDHLTENVIYQGVSFQQYSITASNELASFLSDVLDNMESSLSPSQGQGEGDMQLPDIIMSQEELNKQMQDALNERKEKEGNKPGEQGESGEKGEGENGEKKGKNGQEGKEGQGNKGQGEQEGQNGNGKNGKGNENGEGNGEGNEGGNKAGKGKNGKDGNNGSKGGQEGDNKDGYGQGGNEEQNALLFQIYQQQQMLRQALEDKIQKGGAEVQSAAELIKQMEEVELDLLNKGFSNSTLQKMQDLQHQLLKLDEAAFEQGQDTKRQSKTNQKEFDNGANNQIPTAKEYFNTTEILNRQVLPLQQRFKKKAQDYFKTTND